MRFFDPRPEYEICCDAINKAMQKIMKEGSFIQGDEVNQFEKAILHFLHFNKKGYAVAVSSGTDALVLALKASGVASGDEVLTTPFSFIATVEAIIQVGAKPIFVDINPTTYNMDVERWLECVTDRTRAIIPVHLFGQAVAMDTLVEQAKKKSLVVIEDVAQSMGATCQGQQAGTWGDLACFSFFPSKNLGGFGDAGLITCLDEADAIKLKALRVHGSYRKYEHHDWGYNARMDTLQAAVLLEKIKYLPTWIRQRQENAAYYCEELWMCEEVILPDVAKGCSHTYNQFSIRTRYRDELQIYLKEKGWPTTIYYPKPIHLQPVMESYGFCKGDFPISEQMSQEILSLPIYPFVKREDQEGIVRAIRDFFKR